MVDSSPELGQHHAHDYLTSMDWAQGSGRLHPVWYIVKKPRASSGKQGSSPTSAHMDFVRRGLPL